jgi:hypothetical protein
MEKNYLSAAIQSLRPNSEFSYINDDYLTIKWDVLEGEAPTLEEIESEIARIKALDIKIEKDNVKAKAALLTKLGITAEEAALLLS